MPRLTPETITLRMTPDECRALAVVLRHAVSGELPARTDGAVRRLWSRLTLRPDPEA